MRQRTRDRVRGWLFELLPELNVGKSSAIVLSDLGDVKTKVDSVLSLLYRAQGSRIVTAVLLLPPDSFEERTDESLPEPERKPVRYPIPLFQSWHANVDRSTRVYNRREDGAAEVEVPVRTYWKIPKGSWLVMHGARISRAYAGSFSLDRGPDGTFCRFEQDVPTSDKLSVWAIIEGSNVR